MKSFILLTLVLVMFHGIQSQCTTYPDALQLYNITMCRLTQDISTPIPLLNETFITFSSYDDGVSPMIALPFKPRLYGEAYDSLFISTNGVLFFGANPITVSAYSIPVSSSFVDSAPIVAPFWSNLYLNTSIGSITYSTQGSIGYSKFIVRYQNLQYSTARSANPGLLVSFDVIFDEQSVDIITFRYYRVDSLPLTSVYTTVGLEGPDNSFTANAIINYNNSWSSVASLLQGQSITFDFVGVDSVNYTTCGGKNYDLTSLMSQELSYSDSTGVVWLFRPCGVVQDARCSSVEATEHSMVCQLKNGQATNVAEYSPRAGFYQFHPNFTQTGLQVIYQVRGGAQ